MNGSIFSVTFRLAHPNSAATLIRPLWRIEVLSLRRWSVGKYVS